MKPRRKPDHEAVSIGLKADKIDEPEKIRKTDTHGGHRSTAKGNIEIDIRKQHRGAVDKQTRPDPGTVLVNPDKDAEVIVETRRFERHGKAKDGSGRESATASRGVSIFGRLRRKE